MDVAEASGITGANHAWVVRALDTNFDEYVGKEWPFFKAVCMLQIVSFVLIVDSYGRFHATDVLSRDAWTRHYLQGCTNVHFAKASDQE